MPTKRGNTATATSGGEGKENKAPPSQLDEKDPMTLVMSVIEKKTRNLEKRKGRLVGLKGSEKNLDKDQLEAVAKLPEVVIQIETLRELLTTFQEVHTSQMKEVKKLQKQEEKHRKEAERESQRSLLKYALRTQTILNLIDDNAKESLQSGEGEDVVKLNESELNQLDEFYELVNPTRPGNERYDRSLSAASDHLMYLFERSTKEVAHTTYESMHSLLDKLDNCGYFDKEKEEEEEEEAEEEETDLPPPTTAVEEIRDEVAVTMENTVSFGRVQSPEVVPQQYPHNVITEPNPSASPVEPFVPLVPMTTEGYHPSAPSPDFSGLQSTALSPLEELTFMRESPKPATQQQTEGVQFSDGGGAYNSFDVPKTTHQNFSSFPPPPGGHAPQPTEPTPVGVMESGTLLLDGQYVPETGQQVTGGGGEKDKDMLEGEAIHTSTGGGSGGYYNKTGGNYQRNNSGGNRAWRGNGGYRGNRDMYNGGGGGGGGGGYNRGYNTRGGGGGGGGGNYRGGSNRGRPNYMYNNRSGGRGGGAGGSGYRANVRPTPQ